jgi:hypothetical protein
MKTLVCLLLGCSLGLAEDSPFSRHWQDGQAEVNGYRLTVNRYGQERHGQAVLVYVTEPFRADKLVKTDRPDAPSFEALKLNLIRKFQTGIYDYSTMVSVFVRSADLQPVKTTFSSAEWCGHVFEELLFRPGKVTGFYNSYFENETTTHQLDRPQHGITEDELFIAVRGLRGALAERRAVPFLPSPYYCRLSHKPLTWTTAELTRTGQVFTVRIADGRTGKFTIGAEYPHYLESWELWPDLKAERTGTLRIPYWKLNRNGDEKLLRDLGLAPSSGAGQSAP